MGQSRTIGDDERVFGQSTAFVSKVQHSFASLGLAGFHTLDARADHFGPGTAKPFNHIGHEGTQRNSDEIKPL